MNTLQELCIKKIAKIIINNKIFIDKLNIPILIKLKIISEIINENVIQIGISEFKENGYIFPLKYNNFIFTEIEYKYLNLFNTKCKKIIKDFRCENKFLTNYLYIYYKFNKIDLKNIFMKDNKIRIIFLKGYTNPDLFEISFNFSNFTDLIIHFKSNYEKFDDFYLNNLRTICPEYRYNTILNKNEKKKNKISSIDVQFKLEIFKNYNFYKIKFIIISQNINYY